MRRMGFREGTGGPAVEKRIGFKREKTSNARAKITGGNDACELKMNGNFSAGGGKDSANAVRQSESLFCLRLLQS